MRIKLYSNYKALGSRVGLMVLDLPGVSKQPTQGQGENRTQCFYVLQRFAGHKSL